MEASDDKCFIPSKRQRMEAAQLFDNKHEFENRNIVFSPQYPARSFRLMEVPNELLKAVEEGEELCIVGQGASEAVLCSKSKTYGMKRVETSNCVFFVPPSTSGEFSICSSSSDYYELQQIVPRLDSLAKLVEPISIFPGNNESSFFTVAELASRVQASRAELVCRLRLMGAFELEGKVRTPKMTLVAEHTKALLETIIAQKWVTYGSVEDKTVIELDETMCISSLQASSFPVDPVLLQCVLHSLGSRIGGSDSQSNESGKTQHELPSFAPSATWRLDMNKVKVASARLLLQEDSLKSGSGASAAGVFPSSLPSTSGAAPAAGGMSLADFLLEWRLRTPGMRLQDEVGEGDMALLRGLAVLADDKRLHYMPADKMQTLDAKARLASLFGVKASYTAEELQPYLEGLWGPGAVGAAKSLQELLAPLARFTSATKSYSAK